VPTTAHLLHLYVHALTARRCSPETIRTVRYILTGLAIVAAKRLEEITPDDLAIWQTLRAEEIGGRTLRSHVSYIRVFYDWAFTEGLIPENPARRMRIPRVPMTLPRPISEARLEQALDAADPTMAAILGLAAFAGLRACEIARLTWADCYLDDDEPTARVLGKGDRERIVDVSLELRDMLRAVPGSRRGPVIKRADGSPGHNTANRISKVGNDFLHENDVPDTLHSLRHRFITQVARLGGIHRAREAAGHASITTTSIYTKVLRSEVRPLVEQVGKLLA
jgi:integrase